MTLADEHDQFGMPVARFDYTQCDNDRANIAYAKQTMHAIWATAGAQDVLTIDRYAHLVGGCRMGSDPDASVVDSEHRAWGVSNLFVCDGSVMPTQGSANPALTIMTLASRLAELLGTKRLPPAQRRDGRGSRQAPGMPRCRSRARRARARRPAPRRARCTSPGHTWTGVPELQRPEPRSCASTRCWPTESAGSSSARAAISPGCASLAGTATRCSRR